jgi:osmotically-inducible protein OsmY
MTMADERTRWREDRGRWESDYAPERHPGWRERAAYGQQGPGREGYDYGREYWRQQEDYGDRGRYGGGFAERRHEPYRGSFHEERGGWGAQDWERDRDYGRGRYGGDWGSAYGGGGRYGHEAGGYGWRDRGYDPHRAAGHGYVGDEGYVGVPGGSFWRDDRERYAERYRGRDYHPDERGWFDRAADEVSSWFGDDEAERRREMDERRAGYHHGRGPRGYTRSDDRIREDVNDRLTDDPLVDASDIDVTVSKCEVTLNGTVDNRMAKRRAEDIAERVSGVRHVQNNIRVKEREMGWSGTSATTGTGATGVSGTAKGTVGQKT